MQLIRLPRTRFGRRRVFDPPLPTLPGYIRDTSEKSRKKRRRLYWLIGFLAFVYGFFYALLPPAFMTMLLMPLGVLLLLIIWALPVTSMQPPAALNYLFWAFFVTLYIWPNYLALALPGLPWITVNRLFGGPLLAILLVCASASQPFRSQMKELLGSAGWIWKMVAAFALVQLISIPISREVYVTVNRVISQQIIWTGIFFASVWVFRKPAALKLWGNVMILLAVFVSAIGVLEARRGGVLWANSIPSFLQIEDPAVVRVLSGIYREGVYRVVSTTMSPLSLAEFLALSTAFVLHGVVMSRNWWLRLLLVLVDVLVIYVIVLTDARLGLVGALTIHSVYGLVWAAQRWRNVKGTLIGPAITLAYPAMLATVAIVVVSVPRLRVMILGGGRNQASNDARQAQFEMMPPVFIKSPVIGYGSGQGAERLGYTNLGGEVTIDSYILSILLDYGAVGFILFYGLIIGGIVKAGKIAIQGRDEVTALGIPIAMFLLAFFQIKLVLSQEANNSLLFMMLGAIVALAHYARTQQPRATR